ncbi:flagellar hook assembly protein FlgD [Burkholderia sp. Nafp2/4-1b]|uniref:flagellar hook assembly protein FlgD n=1 Tax=Burkholderia sp. Nafp2/4-1b TaxID=2116686 RepID=UPI000EF93AC2|nr:flagellar hook assembly protein FlgD [Burkholderia sp. Nafp2/4-1b]RKU00821.1 flagellar hook assembly protein FlgD [Burkholderia sp. Nafp2/4-1b]
MTSTSTTIGGNGTNVSTLPTDTMNTNKVSTTGTSASDLQATFLKLLVTQLQNQDPTSPVDSSQMTSQLAQINTVSGIAQLNTSLTSLSTQLAAGQQTQAALLIGTNVLAPGNGVAVKGGAASPFGVSLASDVSNLTITVKNSSGAVVNTINAGKQSAGTVPFNWTPTDAAGNTLPDGKYTVSAQYTGSDGKPYTPTVLAAAQVQSVIKQADGTAGLVLSNGTTVGLTQVASIFPNTASSSTSDATTTN